MTKIIILIALMIIILSFLKVLSEKLKKDKKENYNFIEKYRKQESLLTPTELSFYKELIKVIPEDKGVSFKVRLIDILKPDTKGIDYKVSKSKVLSKHVDFVIFNKEDVSIDIVIELDDKSHKNKGNAERDQFKNRAFESANLPLHRIIVGQDYSMQLANIFPRNANYTPPSDWKI